MNSFDKKYQNLVRKVLRGEVKNTRSGIRAAMICGEHFEHDMNEGFPLTTLKKMPFALVASELEFNIRGFTDKRWLQEKGNHIWDHWCNPKKIPYGRDEDTKKKMRGEPDLGPTYGFQWRHFGAHYKGVGKNYAGKGVDQLSELLQTLKKNPESKRMVVSSWNPADLSQMSIPPCPFAFEILILKDTINLIFFQRSVDVMLGFPFDFAGHALLLHLLSKETRLRMGKIIAYFGNVEIYETHIESAKKLLERKSFKLAEIETMAFSSLFQWCYTDTSLLNYQSGVSLKCDIAV